MSQKTPSNDFAPRIALLTNRASESFMPFSGCIDAPTCGVLPVRKILCMIFYALLIAVTIAALDFDPDRFLDQRLQQYLVRNPFIFMPFNAGPRICLGQQVSCLVGYQPQPLYIAFTVRLQ